MLIKNVSYLDIKNNKIIENVDIHIEKNTIKKIGNNLETKDVDIFNGSNKLAVPSYINSHTHLGMSLMKNASDDLNLNNWLNNVIWPIEKKLKAEDVYWGSLLSLIENIKSGAGTVCDMYFYMDQVAEALKTSKMRGIIGIGLTDITGRADEQIKELKELYKAYDNSENGRIKVIPSPHAMYTCSTQFLKRIVELTKGMNNVLNIHVSETEKEVEDCFKQYGKTPIEYLKDIGLFDVKIIAAHCVHLSDNDINIIKNSNFYPIYNPTSNLKLASGFAPIKKLLNNNIKIGLGTDSSASNNNQNMVEELHIASIINKAVEMDATAVKAIDALKMATINGASALGYDNGIIEEGKLADITFYNLNSFNFTPRNNLTSALCYSVSSEDVTDLIVDGNIIMKDRNILTIDEEKVKYMVRKKSKELIV